MYVSVVIIYVNISGATSLLTFLVNWKSKLDVLAILLIFMAAV